MADMTIKFNGNRKINPDDQIKINVLGVERVCKVVTIREERIRTKAAPDGVWKTEVDLDFI